MSLGYIFRPNSISLITDILPLISAKRFICHMLLAAGHAHVMSWVHTSLTAAN